MCPDCMGWKKSGGKFTQTVRDWRRFLHILSALRNTPQFGVYEIWRYGGSHMKVEQFVDPYLQQTWGDLGARILTSGNQIAVTLGYPALGMQADLQRRLAEFLGCAS